MTAIVWFRQDLRVLDNPALFSACETHERIIPVYIYDEARIFIGAAQKWWLHHSLEALSTQLKLQNLHLVLKKGKSLKILLDLIEQYEVDTVYWNRGYEPQAIEIDQEIKKILSEKGISVISSNGSLLNEPWTIKNKSNQYYKVFTPYWRHCLQNTIVTAPKLINKKNSVLECPSDKLDDWKLLPNKPNWALEFPNYWQPGEVGALHRLEDFLSNALNNYKTNRDFPAMDATSKLSPHLHFGEISPQHIWRSVKQLEAQGFNDIASLERFLSELGWREFSYYLLFHFPTLSKDNFRNEFENFPWKLDNKALECWQQGRTGYPIVDAGMRELWHTGYMHNRVRMIVASFLTKDLMIDWRIGADWFLYTLLDADLANNSASWQWVAGSGADAAPYFRIFNPVLQSEKWDGAGEYIRQWVPELRMVKDSWVHKPWLAPLHQLNIVLGKDYPYPIVDHDQARKQALIFYKGLK